MTISYAVTVCNEIEEVKRLLDILFKNISEDDEVVVLVDTKNSTPTHLKFGVPVNDDI